MSEERKYRVFDLSLGSCGLTVSFNDFVKEFRKIIKENNLVNVKVCFDKSHYEDGENGELCVYGQKKSQSE